MENYKEIMFLHAYVYMHVWSIQAFKCMHTAYSNQRDYKIMMTGYTNMI